MPSLEIKATLGSHESIAFDQEYIDQKGINARVFLNVKSKLII